MNSDLLAQLASQHLQILCEDISTRPTGSPGSRAASAFIAETFRAAGLHTETPTFDCLDWQGGRAHLAVGDQSFTVFPGPFSPSCRIQAPLLAVSTLEELQAADPRGKLLLIHNTLAVDPLMPRHFPFYYPDENELVYAALEVRPPLAVLTATPPGGFLSGGLYPCPMIEDGSFPIPSAYMSADTGATLAACAGKTALLEIDSTTIPAAASNVIGRTAGPHGRIVICAHLDTKPTTPGALDNASGIITLLLLARLLHERPTSLPVELLALNGEDYYSAPGQINYITHAGLDRIRLVINIDGVGYIHGQTAWSHYNLDETALDLARRVFASAPNTLEGEPWYAGDHTMFVLNSIPALAVTSQDDPESAEPILGIVHTAQDRPELVDTHRLAHLALAIHRFVVALEAHDLPQA